MPTSNHKALKTILHIGLAKTGSSAIQSFLFENKQRLITEAKILYPGNVANHFHLHSLFSSNPYDLRQIREAKIQNVLEYLDSYKNLITQEIQEYKPETIIFSSEWLNMMNITEMHLLKSFLEEFSEKIILFAFIRDPFEFSISMFQEMLRSGQITSELELGYMESNIEIISKFESVFSCKINAMPAIFSGTKQNVVKQFCSEFCIDIGIDLEKYANINPSMSKKAACIMSHFNRLYPQYDDEGIYVYNPTRDWMLEALLQSSKSAEKICISKKTMENIYKESCADIDYMEHNYFSDNKIFTNHYLTSQIDEFDDHVGIASMSQIELVEYFLSCLEFLSKRALFYYYKQLKK